MRKKYILVIVLFAFAIGGGIYNYIFTKTGIYKNVTNQGSTTLKGNSATISVWNDGLNNAASIALYLDDTLIIDSLQLSSTPYEHQLNNLTKGDHIMKVKVINTGATTAVSPRFSITDAIKITSFNINSSKDSIGAYTIIVP